MRNYTFGAVALFGALASGFAAYASCEYRGCMDNCRRGCQEGFVTTADLNACESGCSFACQACEQNQTIG